MARYGAASDFLVDEEGNVRPGRDADGNVIAERAGVAYVDEEMTTQIVDLQEPDGTITGEQVVAQTDGALDFIAPTFHGVVWLVMPGWDQPRPMLPHSVVDRLDTIEEAIGGGGAAVIRGYVQAADPADPDPGAMQVGDLWVRTIT